MRSRVALLILAVGLAACESEGIIIHTIHAGPCVFTGPLGADSVAGPAG